VTTEIQEQAEGPLAGRRVAVKDNIEVAGVPMMNGSRTLEGFVPSRDATVVTRLLAAGEADLALGGDQGGSVRIPSSWCGTVGHKLTHGLVPYTGAFPIEFTIDHLGPITRTVADAR